MEGMLWCFHSLLLTGMGEALSVKAVLLAYILGLSSAGLGLSALV